MSMSPIGEVDLVAYVDGRLPAGRQAEVAAWLEAHPEAARRVEADRRHRAAIRAAFSEVDDEPVPVALDLRALAGGRVRPEGWRRTGIAAGLAAALLVGGTGGWVLRGPGETPVQAGIDALSREATASFTVYAADTARPVEIGGADRAGLDRWLSQRLGSSMRAPDLAAAGYRLLGGRLVATAHGAAGLYLYENDRGERIGLLTRPMRIERTARMRGFEDAGVAGFSWAERGFGYSMVGGANVEALHPIANEARRQLTDGPVT